MFPNQDRREGREEDTLVVAKFIYSTFAILKKYNLLYAGGLFAKEG